MTRIFSAAAVFLSAISASAICEEERDSTAPLRIAHIYYNGNHVTKEYVIKQFSELDTSMLFDSLKMKKAKQKLEATGLFLKVTILSLQKDDAIDLYIIVKEPFYFGITALDFTPYSSRYGKSGRWYCPFIGLEYTNLGGRMETVRLSMRFWEWRSIGMSWTKPLFPSKYFIGIGGYADARPDNALTLDRLEYSASITAGRRCFERSKVYCGIIPDYQRKISWTATLKDTSHFYQAFGAAGWITDRRSPSFDPSRGWSFFFETRSNFLYHEEMTPQYVQFASDIRVYHPGFYDGHRAACRLNIVSRTNDAGIQNRLVLGGIGSLRGYANSGIDLRNIANNSIFFSCEYRFPIYQLPMVPPVLPEGVSKLVSRFIGDISALAPRIDGALIADYGRVARNRNNIFSRNGQGYTSGTDFGFGIRIMEPTMRRSASLDIVWPENPYTNKTDFYPSPSWCLYLDMLF